MHIINIDSMSLFYNAIFALELIIKLLINPQRFFLSSWNWISLFIISSSILSVTFENYSKRDQYLFLKSAFLALQLFRFVLVIKDILFLKKIFNGLKLIFMKSVPFFILFFLVLFVYSLVG